MSQRVITCPMCNGAERLRDKEGEAHKEQEIEITCWYCNGSGRVVEEITHKPYNPKAELIILRNRPNPKFN